MDTQHAENKGKVGHASDANNSAAFTFQLDTALNGGGDPTSWWLTRPRQPPRRYAPEVEAVDPMIVTGGLGRREAGEYPGDSYKTVDADLGEPEDQLLGRLLGVEARRST